MSKSEEKSLVVIEDMPQAAMVRQEQIKELGDALMSYHPAAIARKATVEVMRGVAALALATGANPLPGGLNGIHVMEIDGKIVVSLGEGYWSGLTKNYGGVVWLIKPRPMTEQERIDWSIQNGDIAFICAGCLANTLRDHILTTRQYDPEFARAEAIKEISQVGTGTEKQTAPEKKGRSRAWTADKRAETALFKRLVPAGAINQNRRVAPDGRVLGGQGWEVSEFVKPQLPGTAASKSVQDINVDLFGDAPAPRQPAKTSIKEIRDGDYSEAETVPTTPPTQPPAQNQTGTAVPPMDWQAEAMKATNYDTISYRLYQLHKPSGIFKNADELKKHLVRLCGDSFDSDHAALMVEAMGRYVNARADGVVIAEAGEVVKQWYSYQVRAALWDDMPSASELLLGILDMNADAASGATETTAVPIGLFDLPPVSTPDTTYQED